MYCQSNRSQINPMQVRSRVKLVLLLVAAAACYLAYANAGTTAERRSKPAIPQAYVLDSNMYVVEVKGKRLSPAEKAALR